MCMPQENTTGFFLSPRKSQLGLLFPLAQLSFGRRVSMYLLVHKSKINNNNHNRNINLRTYSGHCAKPLFILALMMLVAKSLLQLLLFDNGMT